MTEGEMKATAAAMDLPTDRDALRRVARANAILFHGLVKSTALDYLYKVESQFQLDKTYIGGSSAGATIQGSFLARGDTRHNQIMVGDHQQGFGFLKNVTVDQHTLARNRPYDMFQILQERPELLGLSIDEMTGIVVAGDQFEVIGESYVLVYDGGFWSREGWSMKKLPPSNSLFYFLKAGDRYDMAKRRVVDR